MKYTFNSEKHRCRMQAAGTPIPVYMEPLLVQMDGKEVDIVCDTYDGNTLDYGFVRLFPSLPVKVDLIDCEEVLEECPFPEYPHKDVVCSMERGNVRVSFVNLGEGYDGDYNPDDPTDQNLLRLDVDLRSPFTGEFEEEGSVCTLLPANNPMPVIKRALEALLDCVCEELFRPETDSSLRLRIDSLSYIDEGNIEDYEKNAADARIQRVAYERYQMYWLLDHGITMKDISDEAAKWMDEYRFDNEPSSFESFIAEYGFTGGEIYPCYDEFISSEFNDVDFMLNLLPEEKHEGYLRALGVKAQFYKPNETEKQTEDRVRYVRYWSNACGDLHHFGERDITEEELPAELREAYYSIWSERYDFPCYLVETADGYRGVALIAEFEKDDFAFAKKAAVLLSDYFGGKLCVVLLEGSGYNDAHELVVIVPTSSSEQYMKEVNDSLKLYHVC